MMTLPAGRPIDAMPAGVLTPGRDVYSSAVPLPGPRPKLDFSGFDKPRKKGFGDMLRDPKTLSAFASLLAGSQQANEQRAASSGYAGPSGSFNYYGR